MSAGNEREICRTWLSMLTQAPQRRFAEGRDFEHGSVKGRHEGCYDVLIVYVCRRQACSIVSWVEGGAAIKGSLLGPDEHKRCKAAQDRVGARQKVKTPQPRTKFSFAEGGAVTTRVAVDIYWFGFDWALRVDKAAWAGGLSWAGLVWLRNISLRWRPLPCLLRLPRQGQVPGVGGAIKIKGLQRLRDWACQSCHPCPSGASHPTRPFLLTVRGHVPHCSSKPLMWWST